MKSCFTISLSLSSFIIRIFGVGAAPIYIDHDCPNTTLFTPNSTYQSNLNTLLSSLSSAATHSTDGFANDTAGQNPPNRAYGLFLCRGDIGAIMCSHCVAIGKERILKECPNQRVSVIWYEECMLRYSNQPIFSAMEQEPHFFSYNTESFNDTSQLMQLLGERCGINGQMTGLWKCWTRLLWIHIQKMECFDAYTFAYYAFRKIQLLDPPWQP